MNDQAFIFVLLSNKTVLIYQQIELEADTDLQGSLLIKLFSKFVFDDTNLTLGKDLWRFQLMNTTMISYLGDNAIAIHSFDYTTFGLQLMFYLPTIDEENPNTVYKFV